MRVRGLNARTAASDRPRATTRADRGHPPMGGPPAADFRGRPARVPDLPWPHAGRRVHHPSLGDRPDPRACPDPRRARGARWAAEPPIDAGPHESGRVTRAARPRCLDRPLSTAPSPRHHAGTFGVGGSPDGASDRSPQASPPSGIAVIAAPRGARARRRARRRPSVGARAVGDPSVYPTDPDRISYPAAGRTGSYSAWCCSR